MSVGCVHCGILVGAKKKDRYPDPRHRDLTLVRMKRETKEICKEDHQVCKAVSLQPISGKTSIRGRH
jgi:hypothetical protein